MKYTDPDGKEPVDSNNYVVLPNAINAFNLDFGRDYSAMAAQNFQNGHLIIGAILMLDSASELVYDMIACYGLAKVGIVSDATLASVIGKAMTSKIGADSTVVLGKFSEGVMGGYTKMAEALNKSGISAKVFSMPGLVYKGLEKFGIERLVNMEWLKNVVNSGARILLNTDPSGKLSGAYAEEVGYLKEQGFKFVEVVVNGIKCWEAIR